MNPVLPHADLLRQLEARAQQEGTSVDDLLRQMLSIASQPAIMAVERDSSDQNQTEERLRQLLENIHEVFWLQDVTTQQILYVSPGYEQVWGKSVNSLRDTTEETFVASLHEDDQKQVRASLHRLREGQMLDEEFRVVRPDGTLRWVHARTYPVHDSQGKVYRYAGIADDVTRQHDLLDELRSSQQEARALIESLSTYVIRTDMVGNYTFVNRAFTRRFGWKMTDASFIGTSSMDTIYSLDHPKTYEVVSQCIQEPNVPIPVLLRKETQDGEFFWTLWEFVCLTDEVGIPTGIQCVGVDATELIYARERLQLQSEALQAAANAVVILTPDALIEWANPAFTTLTGYFLDEVRGKPIKILRSGNHDKAFYEDLWNTVLAGRVWRGRLVNRRKGGSLYTEDQTITPIMDESGVINHFVSIKQDITALERAEELRVEQERLKANLQKEHEQLALNQRIISTLSHDLRTSLTVILASRDTLANYYHRLSDERRLEKLNSISNQTRFALELLDETVHMARGNQEQMRFRPHLINLAALCEITVTEIQLTAGSNLHLRFVTDKQINYVQADETLISRILLNLLSNAIKFSPNGGEIRLELLRSGDHIQLQVTDQGMGIDALDQEHIFEPFYRSDSAKAVRGTGLGLSIVHDCVVRHGGEIRVQSELGKGTTFSVRLPLVNT